MRHGVLGFWCLVYADHFDDPASRYLVISRHAQGAQQGGPNKHTGLDLGI